jgi:hypothetical protein
MKTLFLKVEVPDNYAPAENFLLKRIKIGKDAPEIFVDTVIIALPTDEDVENEDELSDNAENEKHCIYDDRWVFWKGAVYGAKWLKSKILEQ